MGGDQSKANSYNEILEKYNVVKKIQDQQNGECTLLKDKQTQQEMILKEINSNDENEFNIIYTKYSSKLALQHPNIVQITSFFLLFYKKI